MTNDITNANNKWGIASEKFFYYCMGLRKGDLSKQVALMRSRYPDDSTERLARRFIAAQIPLSLVGSALIHVPAAIPAIGPAFRFLGLASGTTATMILNMTLLMQIALLYGYDIDDRARFKELMAVIAATGISSASTFVLPQLANLAPGIRAIAGGATIFTTAQLIGETAIKYFSRNQSLSDEEMQPSVATAQ
jgi:hypothetical protein